MKNFSIFKVKEHDGDEKKPTHSISTRIGDKYEYIGKCWTKTHPRNGKYLSCSLDKPYNKKPGFHIEIDIPDTQTSAGVDGEVIDTSQIPF